MIGSKENDYFLLTVLCFCLFLVVSEEKRRVATFDIFTHDIQLNNYLFNIIHIFI